MSEWFLHKKESIIHNFKDLEIPLILTNSRIILTKQSWGSMTFQDISLKHLTSVEAKKGLVWWAIILGIISLVIGIILALTHSGSFFTFVLFIIGIGAILIGIFMGGKEVVFIADSGKTIAVKLKTEGQIRQVITTVREKRIDFIHKT